MRCSSAALFGVHDVTAAGRGGRPLVQVANVKPTPANDFSASGDGVGGYRRRRGGFRRLRRGFRTRDVNGKVSGGARWLLLHLKNDHVRHDRCSDIERWPGVKTLWSGRCLLGDSLVDDGAGRGRRLPLSSHACASAMRLSTRCHKPQRRGGRRRAPRPPRVERRDGLMEGKKRHSEAGGCGR